jgi:16S rRNA (cytidine1402-2'-O)-methyltransferase
VLFESPHRIQRALDDLVAACGPERPVAVCRELTKLHEEVWRCSLGEAAKRSQAVKPRGEYVIVLGPPAAELAAGPSGPELGAVGTEPM